MVVTSLPAARDTGATHDRTARPSRCTVQAPHWAMPHPNFTPVMPSRSRSAQRSGMSSGASTSRTSPLTLSFIENLRSGPNVRAWRPEDQVPSALAIHHSAQIARCRGVLGEGEGAALLDLARRPQEGAERDARQQATE